MKTFWNVAVFVVGVALIAGTFFWLIPMENETKHVPACASAATVKSLEDRVRVIEALHGALKARMARMEGRPEILIEKATVYSGEGEVIVSPMK